MKPICFENHCFYRRTRRLQAQAGYGLALLLVFLASTVLVGTSVQLMLGASAGTYLGASTQDNLSANAVAQNGMEQVLANIQSRLDSGLAVTTSYSFSSTNVTMPTDSSVLNGANSVVGSFSGAVTSVVGNTYTVKITATVNATTVNLIKIVTMVRGSKPLDVMTNANAAYSVRKIRSAYTGAALRVRRSIDNAEQDIGFDINGNLDMVSLNTFLNANAKPLDNVSGAVAAFGMRRLSSTYTGSLLRVRRSSDSNEQDIGYTVNGDLDVAGLLGFVGSGTGYVTKWYDQSGNGNDSVNSDTSKQPTVVTNGKVNLLNNRPTLNFDGADNMPVAEVATNDFTILACYNTHAQGWIIDNDVYNPGFNDYYVPLLSDGRLRATVGNGNGAGGSDTDIYTDAKTVPSSSDTRIHWLAFTRQKSSGNINLYSENSNIGGHSLNTGTLDQAGSIKIGTSVNGGVSEVIMYPSVLSDSNRQLLQRNEGWYYNMAPAFKDTLTDATAMLGSPAGTYSLRKLGSVTKAIQVRRSGDSTTQDIGFDSKGNLDVGTLASFVGSGDGYVSKWYDQSGNGRDYSQSAASLQPRIMHSGILDTVNGKPAIYFMNYQTMLGADSPLSGIGDYSAIVMAKQANAANDFYVLCGGVNTQLLTFKSNASTVNFFTVNGSAADSLTSGYTNDFTSALMPVAVTRATSTITAYVNGITEPIAPSKSGAMEFARIGGLGTWTASDGWLTEVLFYNSSALSASSVNNIMKNMNSYYAPAVPTAYVVKWYDQSGNGNHLIQYNTNMQPTLVMPRSGSVNSWPTVAFNGGQYLVSPTGMPTNADYSKVAVFSLNVTNLGNNIISGNASTTSHAFYTGSSNYLKLLHDSVFLTSNLALTTDTNYAAAATYTQSSPAKTGTVYRENVSGGSATASSNNTDPSIAVGAYAGGTSGLDGTISEAVVFARALSATDRTTIYNDERGYFGTQ